MTILTAVDDIIIKYKKQEELDRLITVIESAGYPVKINPSASKYLGMDITHDRPNNVIRVKMEGAIAAIIQQFDRNNAPEAETPEYAPDHKYGVQNIYVEKEGDADLIAKFTQEHQHYLQQFLGVCLWLQRTTCPDIQTAVARLSTEQTRITEKTLAKVDRIIGYLKRYHNQELCFYASDMILRGQSDASFNSEFKSRSREGGIFYMGATDPNEINGPVSTISAIEDVLPTSAAEAEIVALYDNAKHVLELRQILHDLGYPQSSTLLQTDNECAELFANDLSKDKRLKHIELRFNWLKYIVTSGAITVNHIPGSCNIADFFTKPLHKADFHRIVNLFLKNPSKKMLDLKGCIIAPQNPNPNPNELVTVYPNNGTTN
jgi:hypothetical protein